MEPLQVLSPFCKMWIITFEYLREESFINEVEGNALYHIMTIRVPFSEVTQVWPQSQGLDIAVLFSTQMLAIMEGKNYYYIFDIDDSALGLQS